MKKSYWANIPHFVALSGIYYGVLMTTLATTLGFALIHFPRDKSILFPVVSSSFGERYLAYLVGSQLFIVVLIFLFQDQVNKSKQELSQRKILRARSTRRVAMADAIGKTSHELNNPIAILDGALRILETKQEDKKLQKKLILAMQAAEDRLKNVVDSITTFTEGDLKEEIVNAGCQDLLRDFHVHSLEMIARYGATLDIQNLADNRKLLCRPKQILFVLNVLLENALESLENQRTPGTEVIRLVTRYELKKIRFELEDWGRGIPEDLREQIFSPFTTTKPLGQTLGMNLSLCRVFLEEQKGSIGFVSLPKGTQFWFELPAES